MAQFGRYHFLLVAVVFHLAYIYSIFSIYFVSPIVRGMREHRVESQEAPAKRLVLFVGDGLRADKAFQYFPDPDPNPTQSSSIDASIPRPLAPFLRSKVLESGTFGVSHTRVPTESRPGHVALIAGLYEDVSAVMTGWKLNPVNFDSVFNRSRHTWSWGSPDILPMFQQGAVPGRVDADCYGHEFEDFSKDAWVLDEWVFDRVKKLFADAKTNATLDAELRQEKNVFFLHLLGLDTTGHAHRPYSWQYLHNIQIVDRGVQEITKLIEEFYDDDETAFVFTADHGMSDWGSHGDGHQDNTRTPLVAWGSGVAKPVKTQVGLAPGHADNFSSDWHLDHIQRHDVEQADVAALMAYLVGLDFPTNSVGVLPLAYLDTDEKSKAEAFLTNAKEILEMYHVKEEHKKATEIRYKPLPGLGDEAHSVEHRVSEIQRAIATGVNKADFKKAIDRTYELIDLGLEGIRYLQTYDWLFLRTIITAGYVGWIVFALTTVINLHVLSGEVQAQRTAQSTVFFSSVAVVLYGVLFKQHSPIIYYVYAFFPIIFWEEIFARRKSLVQGGKVLFGYVESKGDVVKLILSAIGFFGLLQALVQSYFIREIYTICYLLATMWPTVYGTEFMRKNMGTVTTWVMSCMAMSVFTMLPANKAEDVRLILFGGVLMFIVGMLYLVFEERILGSEPVESRINEKSRLLIGVQLGLILLAMIVTKSSIGYIQARQGLPLGVLTVGWTTLVASLFLPQLHGLYPNNHYIHRLVVIFLQFAPTFVILSISYEGLFYFAFCSCLFAWMRLEHQVQQHTHSVASPPPPKTPSTTNGSTVTSSAAKGAVGEYRPLSLPDARIALFFIYFLQSAFFSASNIASVSSFSLDAVYRLIPIFDPFSQGALLMLKLMLPFAFLSAVFGLLNRRLGVAPSALFMLVMAVTDVLTLGFFYMVRDEGSWLDIGTGISHFVIASLLGVFVVGLEVTSEWVVRGVRVRQEGEGGIAKKGVL